MTGALTFTSQTSAFNDKNILFSNGGRIGGNIVGEIGIYSAEKVYIKPSSRAASSTTKGVIIDDTGLYPVSTNSDYYLGSSTNKWGNVYGILGVFNGYSRIDLTNQTVDLDTYTLSDGTARIRRYIECTNGGSTNISHLPVTGYPFILDVEAIRYASSTDYITLQTFRNANNPNNEYVRYCTNGTWSNWTTRVFTDTNKYHKSGSWSGLTYTAAAVNSADELKFTIPTGTTATTVALGNHNHDSVYLGINATAAKATADASGNTITTTYATKTEVDGLLAAANAMTFKGTLGTGGTVTALPASHNAGDTYRVITAGTWAGKYCEVGTLIICVKDGTAAADADWTSVETNEDGAVIGTTPTSSTDNAIVRWDGNSGRIIQNSGITIDDNNNLTTTGYINQILLRNVHINNSTSYTTNAITEIFGSTDTASGAKFSILRMQGSAPESLRNNYATGIAWKNSDTHGAISVAYGAPNIKIAGGNGTGMVWWIGLNGTSGQTYTFPSTSKTLAATDGTNASGKWSINTSGKADTAGTADKATAANLATTTNSLAYYTDGTGTFGNTDAYVKYLNHVAANAGTNKAGYIDGLHITGAAYGEAANLISNIAGKMSYGDAGAQIRFTSSGQNGAIIFNHYDNTTPNSTFAASFNFVTDQATGVALKSDGFIINGATTWLRDNNLTFSQGGGWYMNDTAWIRTVGGKSVYMNTGTFRNDGTTQLRLLLHVNPNIVTDGTWETGGTGTDNSGDNYATRGTLGTSVLSIGNAIARPAAGTAGGKNNSKGYLRIYGEGTGYGELSYNDSMFAFNKSIYLTNTTNSGISNEIRGLTATNDYWRIAGGATASNAGYMEIATGDDYNEPIYVRQYSGTFVTVKRTATLLDASGHTEFPVQVTAPKFIGALDGNADSATNISSKLPTLAVATENNEIKVIDLGNSAPEAGLAHRHAIDFRWYNSHWAIGNLRSGSTPSAGFGFSYSADGTTYSNVAIISNEGEINAIRGFKGDYFTVTGDANAQTGKGIDFILNSIKYGHIGTNTGGMLGIYGNQSVAIRPSLTATNRGIKIEASAITPGETNQIDLGASNNVWKNVYATTFTGALSGNAASATSLYINETGGAAYVTDDTHYMEIGYLDCSSPVYQNAVLLISSAFWGNQHGSIDIISIQQDRSANGDSKPIKCGVYQLHCGGSHLRDFYYKKDDTNYRLYLYVHVTGGNSYGKWKTSIIQSNAIWHQEYAFNQSSTDLIEVTKTVATSASTISATGGSAAKFWRGDNTWSDTISGGLLKITNNSNTVTIGSQNTSFTHIYNSANIPFIFNKSVLTTGGTLGSATWPWGGIYNKGYNYHYADNSQYISTVYANAAQTAVGEFYYDAGHKTNIAKGQFGLIEWAPKATADTGTSGHYERYLFPAATAGLTENKEYKIITTKNLNNITSIGTLTSDITVTKSTPIIKASSTASSSARIVLERKNDSNNIISSWQWVNASGTLTLQNNWTSGTYFDVVKYNHTSGNVEVIKNLAVGGASTFGDEATLTKANGGANFGIYVNHTNPNNDTSKAKKIGLMVGGATGSGGVYDVTKGKWIVYSDTAGDVTLNGNALTATTATSAGSATKSGVTGLWLYPENNNEINFGGTNTSTTIFFGYRAKDSRAIPTKFVFGNSTGTADLQAKTVYLGSGTTSYVSSTQYTGNAATASKVSAALNQTAKTYLLGTQTTITATATNVSLTGDTGVYLTTTAGELSALRYSLHYGSVEKAHLIYNNTDDSIDFVFV